MQRMPDEMENECSFFVSCRVVSVNLCFNDHYHRRRRMTLYRIVSYVIIIIIIDITIINPGGERAEVDDKVDVVLWFLRRNY